MIPEPILDAICQEQGVDLHTSGRNARKAQCPRCLAWCLRGLDDDRIAEDVFVDPVALSPLGEALAVHLGLGTYRLGRRCESRVALERRDCFRRLDEAGSLPRADVVPQHRCGRTWRRAVLLAASRLPRPPPPYTSNEPPF